jgi:divalent metal cation (Fe/Co/Zn/Cd) transporter
VLGINGSLLVAYEGWTNIVHPQPPDYIFWAFAVLFFSYIVSSFTIRSGLTKFSREQDHVAKKYGLRYGIFDNRWRRESKTIQTTIQVLDSYSEVFSILIAFVGLILTAITGSTRSEGVATLLIAIIVFSVVVMVVRKAESLIAGESATTWVEHVIEQAVIDGDEVERIIHMKTLQLGPDNLLIVTKIVFSDSEESRRISAAVNKIEARIRDRVSPMSAEIYIEPDVYDPDHVPQR